MSSNEKVIRCAEIKSIPSMTESSGKRSFHIGEYNRATASFEIRTPVPLSSEDVLDLVLQPKPDFDLSEPFDDDEDNFAADHYFQSSFARSIASGSNQSKSLDYGTVNKSGVKAMDANDSADTKRRANYWQIPGQENWRLRRVDNLEVDEELASLDLAAKPIKSYEENLDATSTHSRNNNDICPESPASVQEYLVSSPPPHSASSRTAHERSQSSTSEVDTMLLQSQVTTLQWQLRQAEASRQMHRAVLEQVVIFLKRAHKDLGLLQSAITRPNGHSATTPTATATLNRVPRSRSIHGVDTSPTRPHSLILNGTFQRARSVAQIPDPNCPKHGDAALRGWCGPKRDLEDFPSPGKLSEEAFRLLRTAQSVLNTREPDLTSRGHSSLSSSISADASSASSTMSAALDMTDPSSQETLRNSTGHLADLQAAFGGNCSPIPGLPAANLKDATMSLGRRRRRRDISNGTNSGSPASSADDESGFSSLTSSHCLEVGSQHLKSQCEIIHEEVGLPSVGRDREGCRIHRRWSAMPADHGLIKYRTGPNNNLIRVLWV